MQLSSLQEKLTFTKLHMLYQKSLFVVTLNMMHSQWLNKLSMADIFQWYGDHLYVKGNYDGGDGTVC